MDRAHVVHVAGWRGSRRGRRGGVHRQRQRGALAALVACGVGQGVGQRMLARRQRHGGRECAGGGVVGGGDFDAVHIQARGVGETGRNVQARCGVVGRGRCAGGALDRAHVVHVVGRRLCGRGRCGGVDGDAQRRAAGAGVAGGVHIAVAKGVRAGAHRVGGRDGARGRVIGGGYQDTVYVQHGVGDTGWQCADVDAGCGVVGRSCGAGGTGDGAHVVHVVARRACRRARRGGVDGDAHRRAAAAGVASGVHIAVAKGVCAWGHRVGRGDGARDGVIGGRDQDTVQVQDGIGHARRQCADVDAGCGVVGRSCGAGGTGDGAHVVHVVARRACRRARRGGVDGDAHRRAAAAGVASGVHIAVAKGVRAWGHRVGGRDGAGDGVVGGGDQEAVDVQHGVGDAGWQCADVDAGCGVVRRGCGAGGTLDRACVVHIGARRARWCAWRGGVDADAQRRAAGAGVACRVHIAIAKGVRAWGHRVGGGNGASERVVGGRDQDAVHVQHGIGHAVGQCADVDAGCGVVGGACGAGDAGDRTHVVDVVAWRARRCAWRGGVDGQVERGALAALVACGIGQGVGQCVGCCRQGHVGRECAIDRVVGGGDFDAVHVQARRVGKADTHIQAGLRVVGRGRSAGGALDSADVVGVVGWGSGRCGRCRGVHVQADRRGGGVASRVGADQAQGFCALSVAGDGGGVEDHVPGGGAVGDDGLPRQGHGGAGFVGAREGEARSGFGQVDGAVVVARVAGDHGGSRGQGVDGLAVKAGQVGVGHGVAGHIGEARAHEAECHAARGQACGGHDHDGVVRAVHRSDRGDAAVGGREVADVDQASDGFVKGHGESDRVFGDACGGGMAHRRDQRGVGVHRIVL